MELFKEGKLQIYTVQAIHICLDDRCAVICRLFLLELYFSQSVTLIPFPLRFGRMSVYSSSAGKNRIHILFSSCEMCNVCVKCRSSPPSSSLSCPGLGKGDTDRGMAQFQEMMRQQLESSMHNELEKLLNTATGPEKEVRLLHLWPHTL